MNVSNQTVDATFIICISNTAVITAIMVTDGPTIGMIYNEIFATP
jgi:hypothetical protein